jgi:hypothetical protein
MLMCKISQEIWPSTVKTVVRIGVMPIANVACERRDAPFQMMWTIANGVKARWSASPIDV